MAKPEFVGTVTSAATSVHLLLNNLEMNLVQDGNTWTGKESREVATDLDIQFRVSGFEGTTWALDVSVTCPNGPSSLFSKKGKIDRSGRSKLEETIKMPSDPCAKKV